MAKCYLWGPSFLVSPVTDSLARKQKVYFPAGSNWFDFYTGEKYAGGESKNIGLVEDHIPVFVRGGAFIPMVDPVQSTDLYATDALTIHYYFDEMAGSTAFSMYDDNGTTPDAFEKGAYEMVEMTANSKNGLVEIKLSSEPGATYEAVDRQIELMVHQLGGQPKKVSVQGQEKPFNWNEKNRRITVLLPLKNNSSADIEIAF